MTHMETSEHPNLTPTQARDLSKLADAAALGLPGLPARARRIGAGLDAVNTNTAAALARVGLAEEVPETIFYGPRSRRFRITEAGLRHLGTTR